MLGPLGCLPMAEQAQAATTDWGLKATDKIVSVVDSVKVKTTGPILKIARGVVYGLLAAVVALMVLVLLIVALVRFVNAYLPGDVWATYLLLGSIFSIGGLFLWSKRTP